jgi:hypothetical protein
MCPPNWLLTSFFSVGIPITGMYAVVVAIDWFIDRCSYRFFPAQIALSRSLMIELPSPNPCQRQRRPSRQQDHGQIDRHHRRGLGGLCPERAGAARYVGCWHREAAAAAGCTTLSDQGDGLVDGVDRCRCRIGLGCSAACCQKCRSILFVRCNTDIRCFISQILYWLPFRIHLHLHAANPSAKSFFLSPVYEKEIMDAWIARTIPTLCPVLIPYPS